MKRQVLLRSKLDSRIAFCIVHWNAPEFLLLNISQIEFLHPDSKIYVLDNGSKQANIHAVRKGLEQFDNVTLFVTSHEYPNMATRLGANRLFKWLYSRARTRYTHTEGLQFLLNYSAEQQDEIAVFLDQDCVLSRNIDDLFTKFSKDIVLIGARDYVVIPRDYGPLRKGKLRNYYDFVHASFMILQPNRINQLFGNFSLSTEKGVFEPYHGISLKTSGKILFLETSMHEEIPLFTSYAYHHITYAWHAWFSSRTVGLPPQMLLDGYPVSWLKEVQKLAYEQMKQIHYKTICKRM